WHQLVDVGVLEDRGPQNRNAVDLVQLGDDLVALLGDHGRTHVAQLDGVVTHVQEGDGGLDGFGGGRGLDGQGQHDVAPIRNPGSAGAAAGLSPTVETLSHD